MIKEFFQTLPEWAKEPAYLESSVMQWAQLGLLIFAAVMVRHLVILVVHSRANIALERLGGKSDEKAVKRSGGPIGTLIAVLMTRAFLPTLNLGEILNETMVIILDVLLVVAVMLLIFRLVDVAAGMFMRRAERTATKLDDQLIPIFTKMLKVVIGAFALIFILQNMNINITALLAGVSLGGLALSLAAKDSAANIFSSFSIFTERPFQIGDWIKVGEHEGIVTEVGIRSTRLRSFRDSLVTIPNSIITASAIDNMGLRKATRVKTRLNVSYENDYKIVEQYVDKIRKVLAAHPKCVNKDYLVYVNDFQERSIEILVQYFVHSLVWTDELQMRHEITLECLKIAEELGIEFAYPVTTLDASKAMTVAIKNDSHKEPSRKDHSRAAE